MLDTVYRIMLCPQKIITTQVHSSKNNSLTCVLQLLCGFSYRDFTMFSRHVKKFGILYRLEWRRKWQPAPVFLPGKSHGQRSLVGYSSWGHRVRHDWITSLSLFIFSTLLKVRNVIGKSSLNTQLWWLKWIWEYQLSSDKGAQWHL